MLRGICVPSLVLIGQSVFFQIADKLYSDGDGINRCFCVYCFIARKFQASGRLSPIQLTPPDAIKLDSQLGLVLEHAVDWGFSQKMATFGFNRSPVSHGQLIAGLVAVRLFWQTSLALWFRFITLLIVVRSAVS